MGVANNIHSFLIDFLFASLHFWLILSPKSDSQAENCWRPNLYLMQSVKKYIYWIMQVHHNNAWNKYYFQVSSPSVDLRVVCWACEVLFCNTFQPYLPLGRVFQAVLVHIDVDYHSSFSIKSHLSIVHYNNCKCWRSFTTCTITTVL